METTPRSEPHRVQQRRTRGWRKPENTISVARPSKFGNPVRIGDLWVGIPVKTRAEAVAAFRELAGQEPEYVAYVRERLRGKNLMCFCPLDQPCHADVLLELANTEASDV